MKVIDLLNKIANGEEVPNKIKIGSHIFTRFDFSIGDGTYIPSYESDDGPYFIHDYTYPQDLNREVEIIEEHKIPEKLDTLTYTNRSTISILNEHREKINGILDYLEEIK